MTTTQSKLLLGFHASLPRAFHTSGSATEGKATVEISAYTNIVFHLKVDFSNAKAFASLSSIDVMALMGMRLLAPEKTSNSSRRRQLHDAAWDMQGAAGRSDQELKTCLWRVLRTSYTLLRRSLSSRSMSANHLW